MIISDLDRRSAGARLMGRSPASPLPSKAARLIRLAAALIAVAVSVPAQAAGPASPGPPLSVAVYLGPPYAQVDETGTFSGRSVDLWHRVAQAQGLSYRLIPVKQMDMVLEGVRSRRYDLAIGAITVTPAREKIVDFSHPTHPSGSALAVKTRSGLASAANAAGAALSDLAPLALGLVGLLALLGGAIWRLERRAEAAPTKVTSISEGMYWAAVTMATVGYGDKTPRTGAGRTLAVIWMFASILLTSMFTATIIARLTAAELSRPPASVTDLQDSRLAAVRHASGAEFLSQNGLAHTAFATLPEALAALQTGDSDAVVHSRGALEHAVEREFAKDIHVVPGVLQRTHMAFALPEGDPRKEELDLAIMQVLESSAGETAQMGLAGGGDRNW